MRTLATLCAIFTLCLSSTANADINVADFNSKVIGRLGKPLGSRLVIEGFFADRVMLSNPLLVSVVNGETLSQAVSIQINDKIQIQKDVQYRPEGYESGAFGSLPSWTVGTNGPPPQQSFQFHSIFVVTKVLEPNSK